ncbi:hypothetical protein ACFQRK_22090 [Parapedobacter sp. GCM10030251]|uniref:hypothetical protein n=1 Tax=Parapedobacter sp. GCM10030251 TaxID=3273419 RepID=UPI003618A616
MKGFKINIGNKYLCPAVKEGVVLITFDLERGMNISGLDLQLGEELKWRGIKFNTNEKIVISPVELGDNSSEAERIPIVSKSNIDSGKMLAEYNELKDILAKSGLL